MLGEWSSDGDSRACRAAAEQLAQQGGAPAAWRRRRLKHLAPRGRFNVGPGVGMPGLPGIQQAQQAKREACGSSAARYAVRSRRTGVAAWLPRRGACWQGSGLCPGGLLAAQATGAGMGARGRRRAQSRWLAGQQARPPWGCVYQSPPPLGGCRRAGGLQKLLLLQEQGRQGGREGCSTSHCAAQRPARSSHCCRCPRRPLLLLLLAPACAQHPPNIQSFKSTACAWYRRHIRRRSSAPPRASPCASPSR